ncbi:MAG: hypothetical protein KAQ90_00160, partial [Melioribacteraceae bacterium]|nr:hypothetical protein [Melioribacteraceae bacterium]
YDYAKPKVVGLCNSFGFGDRIGLANPAHLRSLSVNNDFTPVLAQQSIRELTRTQRSPFDVMNAAVWAVFQEGYSKGFGADADHLKTTDDIDRMVEAGFTMFTFDPGDHVVNEADTMSIDELQNYADQLKWKSNESIRDLMSRYINKTVKVTDDLTLTPTEEDTLKALVKYGKSIMHIAELYSHLKNKYPDFNFELEISVDETESITTPFEHFFIANELTKLGIEIVSLAPRFIGEFEKGIDYKGDLNIFKEEYIKHVAIAEHFGTYKISLHSGSDKFDVYKTIGSLHRGYTHVKTAGTSYLEALRVVAKANPELFNEILDFSRENFENEKKTYHVSAKLENVKDAASYSLDELTDLLNQDDARQIFHVTFGLILTIKNKEGNYIYKNRIIKCLVENEDLHYNYILNHFEKHLEPFKN